MTSTMAPRGAAHELGLWRVRRLEVQAAQRAGEVVVRDVALRHGGLESGVDEFVSTERSGEEAAVVGELDEVDERGAERSGWG